MRITVADNSGDEANSVPKTFVSMHACIYVYIMANNP